MPAPRVLILQDAVERLAEFMGAAGDEKNQRAARSCAIDAYHELVQCREWKYYWQKYYVALEAAYSTGTVAYDHTGGTYERQLTLSSGTWPDNALYYIIRIDNVDYTVEDRKTSTVLTLDSNRNPGADIASGETYVAFRSTYTLPGDFRSLVSPSLPNQAGACYISPKEWNRFERSANSSGDAIYWTILGSDDLVGSMSIAVWPYPTTASSFGFIYQRFGRQLSYTGYEAAAYAGTVSGTAAARTITGSGTSFTSDMVGSMLRFGTSSALPDGEGGLNRFREQRVIVDVDDASTLTVDANLTNTHTNVKFRISDPIDLRPTMIPAFRRGCERQAAILKRMDGMTNIDALYRKSLIEAMQADQDILSTRAGSPAFGYFGIEDMPYTAPS